MKKIKYLITVLCLSVVLTGCLGVDVDITVKNDDTGKITFKTGYEESYLKELDEKKDDVKLDINSDMELDIPYEDAVAKDVTFTKGDNNYIGKEVTVEFNSLEQLTERFNELFESEEENKMKNTTFTREGNKVIVHQEANEEYYEESKMMFNYVDYTIKFNIDGKILSNNADKFNEDDNTLEWDIKTVLKNGIQFEYTTSKSNIIKPIYIIGAVTLIVAIGVPIVIFKRKDD